MRKVKKPKEILYKSADYAIVKESPTFYAVYEYWGAFGGITGEHITSGKTFSQALKKLKLLQNGYDRRKYEGDDYY